MKLILVVLILLSTTLAYAVNPSATGYDWIKMEKPEKTELIKTLYYILKVDTNEYPIKYGVQAVDGLYWVWLKDNMESHDENLLNEFFGQYVFTQIAEILTYDGEPPTEEMLKQYRMKLKK